VKQGNLLVSVDHGLNRVPRIHTQLFSSAKEQARAEERNNNAGATHREQELASLAVHQQHATDGHQEIHDCEKDVAPVSLDIGKATLQQNVGVVTNDGVDAGGL